LRVSRAPDPSHRADPRRCADIAARVLGQKLSEQMGEPVVVENRVGSNGNIATELVARAAPTATRWDWSPTARSRSTRTFIRR